MHENRNLYLQARLDTCADVNIMPVSVYKLVFKDPSMEKLIPNKLQLEHTPMTLLRLLELVNCF